jgi:hypothetical protein
MEGDSPMLQYYPVVTYLTTEASVHTRVSPYRIFCGQSGTGTGFSLSPWVPL